MRIEPEEVVALATNGAREPLEPRLLGRKTIAVVRRGIAPWRPISAAPSRSVETSRGRRRS